MKIFSDAAMAAIEDGTAIVAGAAAIDCSPPVRVWSGEGTLTIDGNAFVGIGNRGIAQDSNGAIGSSAQGIQLVLSGIDPVALGLLDAADLKFAPVSLYRLIFDGTGTQLLDEHVFTRGRIDQVSTDETIGEAASITVPVEGAARGLGRRVGRMRTDSDQRLVNAADGGFSRVSYAGQKTLYWGGKRPAVAAGAVNGGAVYLGVGGGGGGAGQVRYVNQ